MNVLPAVGFGLLFLYVAKGNKLEKRKALKEADRSVYRYGNLPDIIGDLAPEEEFIIELPGVEEQWLLKATPPNNEVALQEKIPGSWNRFIFRAKRKGKGAIVFHRAISAETEPLEVVEVNIEVL
jgi:hypothetical protein